MYIAILPGIWRKEKLPSCQGGDADFDEYQDRLGRASLRLADQVQAIHPLRA